MKGAIVISLCEVASSVRVNFKSAFAIIVLTSDKILLWTAIIPCN